MVSSGRKAVQVEGEELTEDWFAASALDVAPALIGARLVARDCEGIIVETEAYLDDEASHAVTRRPSAYDIMCSQGRLYVYKVHTQLCLNITCGDGPGAVLLRAVEPRVGIAEMLARRRLRNPGLIVDQSRKKSLAALASGPGRLCQAFGVELGWSGEPLGRNLRIFARQAVGSIVAGPRVGISKATELPWRFCLADSPFLSRPAKGSPTGP